MVNMASISKEWASCPLCNNQKTKLVIKKKQYCFCKCNLCCFCFVPQDNSPTLSLYNEEYFTASEIVGFGYSNYDQDKIPQTATYERYLSILERCCARKEILVDVGAATGFFVGLAAQRGWNSRGIEVSDWAVSQGVRKGLKMMCGTLRDSNLPENSVDAFSYIDVFEHLFDPLEELKIVNQKLKPGGLLIINTPDVGSLSAKVMGARWPHFNPPEHLYLWSKKSLHRVLLNSGFRIEVFTKVNKSFTVSYLFSTVLPHVIQSRLWSRLKSVTVWLRVDQVSVPIPSFDSITVVARKVKSVGVLN